MFVFYPSPQPGQEAAVLAFDLPAHLIRRINVAAREARESGKKGKIVTLPEQAAA